MQTRDLEELEPIPVSDIQGGAVTRADLLQLTSRMVRYLHSRALRPRFKPSAADVIRLQYCRAATAAVTATASVLKDSEIDALKLRLDAIEGRRT